MFYLFLVLFLWLGDGAWVRVPVGEQRFMWFGSLTDAKGRSIQTFLSTYLDVEKGRGKSGKGKSEK